MIFYCNYHKFILRIFHVRYSTTEASRLSVIARKCFGATENSSFLFFCDHDNFEFDSYWIRRVDSKIYMGFNIKTTQLIVWKPGLRAKLFVLGFQVRYYSWKLFQDKYSFSLINIAISFQNNARISFQNSAIIIYYCVIVVIHSDKSCCIILDLSN